MTNENTQVATTSEVVTPTTTERARDQRVVWYRPAVDVLESDNGFRLVIDVPGVRKDALELQVQNRRLTVSGRRATGSTGWRHAFTVPDTVDTTAITADLQDGVLTLELPRKPELGPRRIQVA
ncbi:MAG: Hsp20 family protein [Alphaproteobacteria bacterium]|nr:Hsp20 family protein [Alphaproteobacteria bacterium]MCB9696595.1 Hsp20 family protein [Alphaproteobacteria bacterium]